MSIQLFLWVSWDPIALSESHEFLLVSISLSVVSVSLQWVSLLVSMSHHLILMMSTSSLSESHDSPFVFI